MPWRHLFLLHRILCNNSIHRFLNFMCVARTKSKYCYRNYGFCPLYAESSRNSVAYFIFGKLFKILFLVFDKIKHQYYV